MFVLNERFITGAALRDMKYDLKVDRCMCDYAGVVQTTGLKEGLLWRPTGNLSAVGIGELRLRVSSLLVFVERGGGVHR